MSKNSIVIKKMGNNEKKESYIFLSTKKIGEKKSKNKVFLLLVIGVFIGFINGFWGGGGGMLCVPALTFFMKEEEKVAHATTIFVMLPLCMASVVAYIINGAFNLENVYTVTGGFVVGGIIGAIILKKINNFILNLIFAVVIIAGGIRMLF